MNRPRYELIAIDLDGTLLSPTGTVTPRTRAAIRSVLDAGMFVCFATGRNWTESRPILDAVSHYPCAVFVGGAMVIDTRRELTLHRTLMAPALAGEISRTLEEMGHAVLALQDTGATGVDYLISDNAPLNEQTNRWMRATHSRVRRVKSLATYAHQQTIRLGIVTARAEADRARQYLREQYGSRVMGHVLNIPGTGCDVLELFDPAVNKWRGVLQVADLHGVAPERIIAVGDDVNDVAMVRGAGLGVAMGNARPEVRAVADRVIESNEREGLAEFLEELTAERHAEAANVIISQP